MYLYLRLVLTLFFAILLSGCVAFSMVEPGPTTVGDLQLDASVALEPGAVKS